jgi:sugar phosphate permease
MYFITYVDRVNISTAAPLIGKEFGLSKTELGIVFSAFGYPYAIFQVIGGLTGDKFGARRTLFFCGLIWATATILTGLAGGFVSLFLARLILGFGEGATFPVATRAMQNWVPASKRGFAQGITHSFARAAFGITPPVVVFLIEYTSWRGSFFILGSMSLIWVFAWLWYFRDDPKEHKAITAGDLATLAPYGGDAAQPKPKIPWRQLTLRILPVSVTYFCYGWVLWLLLYWLPSFFKDGYQLDLKDSALYTAAISVAGVVGDIAGGFISDRILRATGNRKLARLSVINIGMLGAVCCLVGVVLAPKDVTIILMYLSLGFFFLELVIGPIWSVPMDIAPEFAGTASGLMNTGSAIAAIVSPIAFGAIVDWTGDWVLPFAVSIGVLLLGVALSFTMHPERKFQETDGPALAAASPAE